MHETFESDLVYPRDAVLMYVQALIEVLSYPVTCTHVIGIHLGQAPRIWNASIRTYATNPVQHWDHGCWGEILVTFEHYAVTFVLNGVP